MTTTDLPPLGIVSNCWRAQFDQQESLDRLIDQAIDQGFTAIELRQGSLGDYEQSVADAHQSAAARATLADLANRFPTVEFNLAVSLPVFSGVAITDSDSSLQSALAASEALSPHGRWHLRIVDTDTRSAHPDRQATEQAAHTLSQLATRVAESGGWLSIEHAYQSWHVFRQTIDSVRRPLEHQAGRLRICLDPCNLLLTEPAESICEIVRPLTSAEVSMIHFKQRKNGMIQPDVDAGDVDWLALRPTLARSFPTTPCLFEVAPHLDLWNNLQRSIHFLFAAR